MQTILEKPIETRKHRGNPNWGIALPYSVVRDAIKPMRFKNLIQYREWVEETKPEGFPLNPYAVYSRRGDWQNSRHFLGKIDSIITVESAPNEKPVKFRLIRSIINQILNRH